MTYVCVADVDRDGDVDDVDVVDDASGDVDHVDVDDDAGCM